MFFFFLSFNFVEFNSVTVLVLLIFPFKVSSLGI